MEKEKVMNQQEKENQEIPHLKLGLRDSGRENMTSVVKRGLEKAVEIFEKR